MTPAAWSALGIAVFGAISYAAGSILQAVGARRSTGTVRTLGHPLYLLGVGCDILSWAGSMVALRELAVYQVQSILAGSLAITVVMARVFLGSRVRRRDAFAVIITTGALAVLAMSAGPQQQVAASTQLRFGFCAAAVLTVVLGWIAAKFTTPGVVAGLSGLAFGGAALAGRALSLPEHPTAHLSATVVAIFTEPLTAALVTFAAAGMLMYTHALQHGQVGPVTAVLWIGEVVAPSAVGLLLLGDTVMTGWELRAAVAGFIVVASAVVLATAPGTSDAAQAAQDVGPVSPAGGRVGSSVGASPALAGVGSPAFAAAGSATANARMAAPVYARPVHARPVYARPVHAQPVHAQSVHGQPVYARPPAPAYAQPSATVYAQAAPSGYTAAPVSAQPTSVSPHPSAPVSAQPTSASPHPAAPVSAQPSATVYAAASSTYPVWPPPNWHEPTPPPGRLADGMTVWWGPPNDRRPIYIPPDRPRTAWTTTAPTPAPRHAPSWERHNAGAAMQPPAYPPTPARPASGPVPPARQPRPEPGWTQQTSGAPPPAWTYQTGGLPVSAAPAWTHQTGGMPVPAPPAHPAHHAHPAHRASSAPAWARDSRGGQAPHESDRLSHQPTYAANPTWAPQSSPEPAPAWINHGGVPTLAHPSNPARLRQVINAEPVPEDHWPLPPQAFFPGAKSA